MGELETSQHLFQAPLYYGQDSIWHSSYQKAVSSNEQLTVDPGAVLSILNFGWICGDLTLFREIKRRPWLSEINDFGEVELKKIPEHGCRYLPVSLIAKKLILLLENEAERVCAERNQVCLLLSGGLDSRIVAGVLSRLQKTGRLKAKPLAVTWGFSDSRDVHYARYIAKLLDFDWHHIEFGPETVLENIKVAAEELGCMHSPEMLHYMTWFKNLPEDTLVLAGSYGDSIGRAEFAGKHLLELKPFHPKNPYSLFNNEAYPAAYSRIQNEFSALRNRAPGAPLFAHCEHEMQGHRMRGGLSHALTIINKHCKIYQMFTDPSVYSFMWSIHPAYRNDDVYAEALTQLDSRLAQAPWARTNKALSGLTAGALPGLREHYHDYTGWSQGPLYNYLNKYIDSEWFNATGLFNGSQIDKLKKEIKYSKARVGRINDIWLWLACFRNFIEFYEKLDKNIIFEEFSNVKYVKSTENKKLLTNKQKFEVLVRQVPSKSITANKVLKEIRMKFRKINRFYLRKRSLKKHPITE